MTDGFKEFASRFKELNREADRSEDIDRAAIVKSVDVFIRIARDLGIELRPGDRVLDLGCGIGEAVEILLSKGVDAYGVDVGEWWGSDYDAYWKGPRPPANVCQRLRSVNQDNYVLPYPDSFFTLIISFQTFEHVFDYEDVFREIGRVLRPEGLSINIFPGPGTPIEPHLHIPIIPLCKYDWWLALWAYWRRSRPTWRETYDFMRRSMKLNNYPSRAQLQRHANASGVSIDFCEKLYVENSDSRPTRIVRAARPFGLAWPASAIVQRVCQRTMVLRKGGITRRDLKMREVASGE